MSASFHEVQFPPTISLGAVGGPGFKTIITEMSGGAEKRNISWAESRATYDVSQGLKTQDDIDALKRFFYARIGRAFGFRFKDWTDFVLPDDGEPNPLWFTTNGLAATFQIVKFYGDTANTYTRVIAKPVAGSLVVYDNGSPVTDYTVDLTTGLITLGHSVYVESGHLITGSCQFDTPVRFDTDQMKVTVNDIGNFSWGSIPVIETRDI